LLSDPLRHVFEILYSDFIARHVDQIEPFIRTQYGTTMSAWAEASSLVRSTKCQAMTHIREDLVYPGCYVVDQRELPPEVLTVTDSERFPTSQSGSTPHSFIIPKSINQA
jgi:hypothetical protein